MDKFLCSTIFLVSSTSSSPNSLNPMPTSKPTRSKHSVGIKKKSSKVSFHLIPNPTTDRLLKTVSIFVLRRAESSRTTQRRLRYHRLLRLTLYFLLNGSPSGDLTVSPERPLLQ